MRQLIHVAENHVCDDLLETFSIILDGWSANNTHCATGIVAYPSSVPHGIELISLGCSFMVLEGNFKENVGNKYLSFVLSVCGKDMQHISVFTDDNCYTN